MSKGRHTRYKLFLVVSLLWLAGCLGVLDVQIEREPAAPAPALGKVATIAGGDVWLVDLDSSQQLRLTRDGRNSHPLWSADGQWLAYRKQDTLWVNRVATGEELQVSRSSVDSFTWSPQENRLAYLSAAAGLSVWDHNDRSSRTLLAADTALTLASLAWHPNGQRLAYQTGGITWGLNQIALDGTSPLVQYTAPNAQMLPHLAGWSPDGRQLLAWLGPGSALYQADGLPLCVLPVVGGEPRCLADERVLLWPDFVAWSPVTNQLAFIAGAGRETWVNKGLAIVADAGTFETRWLVAADEQAPLQPDWSPQGERLVYSAGPATPAQVAYAQRDGALAQRRIWTVEVASGLRRQLTDDNRFRDERPLWSADGQHILFARLSETEASLWLMTADGRSLEQVVPELTPRPDPVGEYGYIEWPALWDWWRPGAPGR
jgi:dipeptidyl aminopeptidase/acylaminoacyl peptidase